MFKTYEYNKDDYRDKVMTSKWVMTNGTIQMSVCTVCAQPYREGHIDCTCPQSHAERCERPTYDKLKAQHDALVEATQRPLAGAWWQDPNDNRIHDAEGNDVLDHMTVTEIGRRVNSHDALAAAIEKLYSYIDYGKFVNERTDDADFIDAVLEQVK